MKHKEPQPPTPAKVVGIDEKFETATSYLRSTAHIYQIPDPSSLCDMIEALEHRCLAIAYALGYERANELHEKQHGKVLTDDKGDYQYWKGEAISKHFTFKKD